MISYFLFKVKLPFHITFLLLLFGLIFFFLDLFYIWHKNKKIKAIKQINYLLYRFVIKEKEDTQDLFCVIREFRWILWQFYIVFPFFLFGRAQDEDYNKYDDACYQ